MARPVGQVRIGGGLSQARCEAGAAVGDTVRIEIIEGLTLIVTPEQPQGGFNGQAPPARGVARR
jgi:membrane-bound ClpP family serine protease